MQLVVVQVSGKEAGGHRGAAPRGPGPGNHVGSGLAEGRACLATGPSAGALRGQRRLGGPGSRGRLTRGCWGRGGTLDAPRAHPSPTPRPPQEGAHPRGEPGWPAALRRTTTSRRGLPMASTQAPGPRSPSGHPTVGRRAQGSPRNHKHHSHYGRLGDVHGAVTTRHPARLSSRDMLTSDRNIPSQLE